MATTIYAADICQPECGCRVCPGKDGFPTYGAMVMHEHVMCEHQAAWFREVLDGPRAGPVSELRAALPGARAWLTRHTVERAV